MHRLRRDNFVSAELPFVPTKPLTDRLEQFLAQKKPGSTRHRTYEQRSAS
jgi:hypothetical protein